VPVALPTPPSRLLPKQRVALQELEFRVPLYARGGQFSVVPEIGGAVRAGNSNAVTVTIEPRQVGRTVAEVKVYHGTPTLFINGEAQNGMTWATYGPTAGVFRDFTQAGAELGLGSVAAREVWFARAPPPCLAPGAGDLRHHAHSHQGKAPVDRPRVIARPGPGAGHDRFLLLQLGPCGGNDHPFRQGSKGGDAP
jgi:hypothetical protein